MFVILFVIGWISRTIFYRLGWPSPALLGTMLAIGTLRALDVALPQTPPYFEPLVQILLGFFMAGMVSLDVMARIKKLLLPAVLVMSWVFILAFLSGSVLARLTLLDPITAILGSSVGGLPEMTVIAVDTRADATVVILMHVFRLVAVIISFPLLVNAAARRFPPDEKKAAEDASANRGQAAGPLPQPRHLAISGVLALTGGSLAAYLGVPAGGMVGAIAFVVFGAFAGVNTRHFHPKALEFVLIGVGIMAADSITPEIVETLFSPQLLLPLALSTLLLFGSSFFLAYLLYRLTSWSLTTCLVAAAPGGLSAMAALALELNIDPIPVSILHLCRVLVLKMAIPVAFLFFF